MMESFTPSFVGMLDGFADLGILDTPTNKPKQASVDHANTPASINNPIMDRVQSRSVSIGEDTEGTGFDSAGYVIPFLSTSKEIFLF
jgi:hypothetical protein